MLNPAEMVFLAEYAAVMKPVAMALNILQGETSVHMGFLLPTLHQLQNKLKKLDSTCKVCGPLIDVLQDGIQKHFGEILEEPELIAAAILRKFRTSWTTEESILKAGFDYIKNHLDTDLDDDAHTNSSQSNEDDFFASMRSGKLHRRAGELPFMSIHWRYGSIAFLSSNQEMSLKVNTGLPASATCERLFSRAGLLFTAKR